MRLTLYTEYALRVMIYLAINRGKRFKSSELARELGASQHHLNKVVQQLSRLGVTRSVPGIQGGIELLMKPDQIKLGWVLRETEPQADILKSVQPEQQNTNPVIKLKQTLLSAQKASYEILDDVNLEHLIKQPTYQEPPLQVHQPHRELSNY